MGQKAIEAGLLSLRIAKIIRRRKEEVAISDYALADMSGIPRQRLRRAMVGDRPFLVDDLEAVATALGLIPWQVMREAEQSLEDRAGNVLPFPSGHIYGSGYGEPLTNASGRPYAALDRGYDPDDEATHRND